MTITQVQLQNIRKLNNEDSLILLHECAENLGIISVDEYHELTKMPKRTIYENMNNGKIKFLEMCGRKLIIMND